MASNVSFPVFVRQRAREWPRVAELIASLLNAARQRDLPIDRSNLFALRNPEYRAREWDRLARHYDAWRTVFESQDIIALRTEREIVRRQADDLVAGGMSMGKAYRRLAAHRRIALLDEFIRLKTTSVDWPSVYEIVMQDDAEIPD